MLKAATLSVSMPPGAVQPLREEVRIFAHSKMARRSRSRVPEWLTLHSRSFSTWRCRGLAFGRCAWSEMRLALRHTPPRNGQGALPDGWGWLKTLQGAQCDVDEALLHWNQPVERKLIVRRVEGNASKHKRVKKEQLPKRGCQRKKKLNEASDGLKKDEGIR